jgi:hypothetical protein
MKIQLLSLDPNLIEPNDWNPNFMKTELVTALSTQIQQKGFLQQILVYKPEGKEKYVIVDGEHRWSEAITLGLPEIEVVFIDEQVVEEIKSLTLSMNLLRGEFDRDKLDKLILDLKNKYSLLELVEKSGLSFVKTKSAIIRVEGGKFKVDDSSTKRATKQLPSEFSFTLKKEESSQVDSWMIDLMSIFKLSSEDEVFERVFLILNQLIEGEQIQWNPNLQKLQLRESLLEQASPLEQTPQV